MPDPRHNSRIIALQLLFQESFQQGQPSGITDAVTTSDTDSAAGIKSATFPANDLLSINEIDEHNQELTETLYQGVLKHQKELDAIIERYAPEFPIKKIAFLDTQILRIAILEGFLIKITPRRVAIDEAIELSKEFSNDQSRKFISGVLGSIFTESNSNEPETEQESKSHTKNNQINRKVSRKFNSG